MININDIKNGMTVIFNSSLCSIMDFQHVKPARGPAFIRIKYKNLKTGAIIEETFNSNIKVQRAHVERLTMSYLYNQGDSYIFMNTKDYTQLEVNKEILKDNIKYLKENLEVELNIFEGDIVDITLPEKIEYEVINTTDAVKGNTSGSASKDATIETGLVIKVPLFIKQGEKIIVNTNDGKYDSRA